MSIDKQCILSYLKTHKTAIGEKLFSLYFNDAYNDILK